MITKVIYDWFYSTDIGEESRIVEVGKEGVSKIIYNAAQGKGDQHYCDVYYKNNTQERVFNLNRICFDENK